MIPDYPVIEIHNLIIKELTKRFLIAEIYYHLLMIDILTEASKPKLTLQTGEK